MNDIGRNQRTAVTNRRFLLVAGFGLCLVLALVATWRRARMRGLERGLRAEYFPNADGNGPPVLVKNEPTISPDTCARLVRQSKLSPTDFSVRWQGWLRLESQGDYRVHLEADDRAVVRIGPDTVIRSNQAQAKDEMIRLTRGFHRVEVEFANDRDIANFALSLGKIHHAELQLVGPRAFFPALPALDMRLLALYPQLLWLLYWGMVVFGIPVLRPLLRSDRKTRLLVTAAIAVGVIAAAVLLARAGGVAGLPTAGHSPAKANLYVLASCALLGLSFYGYGAALLFGCGLQRHTPLGICAGAAAVLLAGGILNLLKLVSTGLNLAVIIAGAALGIFHLARAAASVRAAEARKNAAWIVAAVAILLLSGFHALANGPPLNPHDDAHGYLNHPKQMLAVGYLQEDPFNTRRSVAFGGQAYLQSLYLALGNRLESIGYLDALLFRLVFGLSMFLVCLRYGVPAKILGLAAFAFAGFFFPVPQANTSAHFTTMAFFFALVVMLVRTRFFNDRRALVLPALVISALLSLKLQNVVILLPTGLLCIHYWLSAKQRTAALVHVAILGLLSVVFCLPWLLDMYRATGSLFVPLLGKGIHAPYHEAGLALTTVRSTPVTARYVRALWDMFSGDTRYQVLVLLLLPPVLYAVRRRRLKPALGAGAVVVSTLIILLKCDSGYDILAHRYTVAYIWPLILFLLFYFVATRVLPRHIRCLLLAAAVHLLIIASWHQTYPMLKQLLQANIHLALPHAEDQVPAAQQAIPPGSTVLLFHANPYTFDTTRNRVFIADYAGMLGPLPGFKTDAPHAAVQYLDKADIDYIIYSHADAANYGRGHVGHRLHWSKRAGTRMNLLRIIAQQNIQFGESLQALIASKRMIYYDERDVVLSCSPPSQSLMK